MRDGMISPGSQDGILLGFTSERFDGWLWKKLDRVFISMVTSKEPGRGNLSRLFDEIERLGFRVAVPSPLGRMEQILLRKGFVPRVEHDHVMGDVTVFMRHHV